MNTDTELLACFATSRDANAFAALVARYLPLVYAAARRRVGDPALADDVCQAVFLILANKAATLDGWQPIGDWLLTVTRYTAANAMRQRARRAKHERAAAKPEAAMQTSSSTIDLDESSALSAHLDAALDRLSTTDRRAILLRYYDAADFATVAASLNVSEAAARKRVTRATEKLRSIFARRGVTLSTVAIAATLPALLTLSPPAALAASIPLVATSASSAALTAALLAKGTLKAMLMTKIKTAVAAIIGITILAGAGTGLTLLAQAPSTANSAIVPLATKPVVGWIKVEMRRAPDAPPTVYYVEPLSGRRMVMGDRANGAEVVRQFRDPVAGVSTRWLPETNQFVIGMAGDDRELDVEYTEAQLLTLLAREPGRFKVNARPGVEGERVIDIVADASAAGADSNVPSVMEMHADVATGLVKRLTASASADGKQLAYDLIAVTEVAAPPVSIDQPEKTLLPAGAAVIDNRPSAEIRDLLTKLDDIVTRGPGFDVGLIVQRHGNVYTGDFYDDSAEITLCAGTIDRFVLATWVVGKSSGAYPDQKQFVPKPAGWPKPTLPTVLAAVGKTRPNRFVVYDGKTCWASNDMIGGARDPIGRTVTANHDDLWRNWSIVGRLWGHFPLRGSVFTHYTLTRDASGGNHVTLEAETGDYYTFGPATRPAIQRGGTIRMKLATDLGPFPLRIESINDGAIAMSVGHGVNQDITDIELSAEVMYRDPIRVPLAWRRLNIDDSDPSLPEYSTLIPYPDSQVPTEWFQDPAVTWPKR